MEKIVNSRLGVGVGGHCIIKVLLAHFEQCTNGSGSAQRSGLIAFLVDISSSRSPNRLFLPLLLFFHLFIPTCECDNVQGCVYVCASLCVSNLLFAYTSKLKNKNFLQASKSVNLGEWKIKKIIYINVRPHMCSLKFSPAASKCLIISLVVY